MRGIISAMMQRMQENNSLQTARYASLNGLRAISIIIVIVSHLALNYAAFPEFLKSVPLITDGKFAVNVFFVISGFLITRLLLQEEKLTKNISLKNFFIRRILRIFPAYYFLLSVYFILSCVGFLQLSNQSWLTSITYTKYFNWNQDWYTGHAWSLSIEEHFYLLWPLFFTFGPRGKRYFIFAVLLIVPVFRAFSYYNDVSWINPLTIFYRFDAIATGCLFALYQEKIVSVLTLHWKKYFYIAIALLLSLSLLAYFNDMYDWGLDFFIISIGSTYGTIANLLIAVILLCSVFGPQGIWFKFLNSRIMERIGILSYSIYLWQQLFTAKEDHFINRFPINIAFIIAASLCSYYFIEKPFLKLKTRFSSSEEKEEKPLPAAELTLLPSRV
jgi:peptidoglycan/LPS O-acetylase OafA/YrhL